MKIILIVLALFAITGQAHAYTIEITQEDLQSMVAAGFPITQRMPFVNTVLSNPKIRIVTGSDRLRLSVVIATTFSNNITSTGKAEIEGGLDYDSGKGEFHLREPTVTRLQFDQIPQQQEELISAVVNALAQQTLPIIVIYRLDEHDFKQAMTRSVLKGIRVKDGKLIAKLDW